MLLIVGLGNPGVKYKNTYHNIGFMVVDALAEKLKIKFKTDECSSKTVGGKYKDCEFVLAKPQTFMNLSGEAVKQLINKYCYDESELIVVYDDADLPLGKLRLREEGSSGTHNGMRNIVKELNSTSFKRLRIGIKTDELKEKQIEIIDHVLSKIDYGYKLILNDSVSVAVDALTGLILGEDIARIEEKTNKKTK